MYYIVFTFYKYIKDTIQYEFGYSIFPTLTIRRIVCGTVPRGTLVADNNL